MSMETFYKADLEEAESHAFSRHHAPWTLCQWHRVRLQGLSGYCTQAELGNCAVSAPNRVAACTHYVILTFIRRAAAEGHCTPAEGRRVRPAARRVAWLRVLLPDDVWCAINVTADFPAARYVLRCCLTRYR